MAGIRVFSPSSVRPDTITNVVYRELLDVHVAPPVTLPIPVQQIEVAAPLPDDDDTSEDSYDDY
jgi:hypothetical protein